MEQLKDLEESENIINNKSELCCNMFYENINKIEWYSLNHLGKDYLVMPNVNDRRVNFCPYCGKNVRDLMINKDLV